MSPDGIDLLTQRRRDPFPPPPGSRTDHRPRRLLPALNAAEPTPGVLIAVF